MVNLRGIFSRNKSKPKNQNPFEAKVNFARGEILEKNFEIVEGCTKEETDDILRFKNLMDEVEMENSNLGEEIRYKLLSFHYYKEATKNDSEFTEAWLRMAIMGINLASNIAYRSLSKDSYLALENFIKLSKHEDPSFVAVVKKVKDELKKDWNKMKPIYESKNNVNYVYKPPAMMANMYEKAILLKQLKEYAHAINIFDTIIEFSIIDPDSPYKIKAKQGKSDCQILLRNLK